MRKVPPAANVFAGLFVIGTTLLSGVPLWLIAVNLFVGLFNLGVGFLVYHDTKSFWAVKEAGI